jgi:hypothetical protein
MDPPARTVYRNRCSKIRQEGHNRTRCPHDAATAASLRDAFNTERRAQERQRIRHLQERQATLNSAAPNPEWRAAMYAQVTEMQERLATLTRDYAGQSPFVAPRSGPTVREVKIQEILFDHCQEIPEGLYKELMDALVIRD